MSEKTNKDDSLAWASPLLAVPSSLLRAFVLTKLWSWFVVPLGMKPIGLVEALGVSLVAWFLTYTYVPSDEENSAIKALIWSIFMSLMAWGFGAIYAWFR
jgi:hypothetical protein